jgi:hypothetical protein
MTLTRESVILITICALDLLTTLFLIGTNVALEGNPIMGFYLNYGIGAFVAIKLALIVLPIFIAEWSKQYRPQFVRLMLRATIAAYVGVYLGLFLAINVGAMAQAAEYEPEPRETQLHFVP